MAGEPLVSRVYKIEVQGYDGAIQRQKDLTKAFKDSDDAKRKLNESLKDAVSQNDTAAVAKLTAEIGKLQTQQNALQGQLSATRKEADALTAALEKLRNVPPLPAPAAVPTSSPTASIPIPTVEISGQVKSIVEVTEAQARLKVQLQLNAVAQKQLTDAIRAGDGPLDEQYASLAALIAEQAKFRQENNQNNVTLRNLTNEFLAQDGAIVQLSSQLNVLRQTYDRLSESERNSDAGKSQLTNIQQLDSALKALDGQQGRFNRNVGDYKQQYNGLNVAIQQILRETPSAAVSLNTFFLAISNNLPQLFDELQKTSAATKAATAASKEAAVAAGAEAINRATAAGATGTQAAAAGLLAEKQALANAAGAAAPSLLKQITSSLFSLNSFLTIGVLALTLFGGKIVEAVSALFKTKDAVNELNVTYGDLNKVIAEANKSAGDQLVNTKALLESATNLNIPIAKRLEYAKELKKEFPQLLSDISAEAIANGKAKISYEELSKSILDNAKARAAQGRIGDYASQLLTVADNIDKINAVTKTQIANASKTQRNVDPASGVQLTYDDFILTVEERRKASIKDQQTQRKILEDRIAFFTQFAGGNKAIADDIIKNNKITEKEAKDHADKLSAADQNAFKEFDRIRAIALADAERDILNLRQRNQNTFEAEQAYLLLIQKINNDAITSKQDYLNAKGKLNKEEALTDAELGKDRADIALKTQDAIVALRKRESDRLKSLSDAEFNDLQNDLQRRRDAVINNPDANDTTETTNRKALEARQEYLAGLRVVEALHFEELRVIERRFGQDSTDEEKKRADALLQIETDINRTTSDLVKARYAEQLRNIQDGNNRITQELVQSAAKQIQAIFANTSTTNDQKAKQLSDVERKTRAAQLQAEIDGLYKLQTRAGIASADFAALETEIQKKLAEQAQLANKSITETASKIGGLSDLIRKGLRGLFGVAEGSATDQLLGETLSRSYAFATDVMNQYYDARRERIEQDRQLSYDRIDLEKEQLLAQAQSADERNSIERQAAQKKRDIDKAALEQYKKQQKAQAEINLGIALSNLAVVTIASLSPANIATLGVAGAIAYGVQAALLLAQFALAIGKINSATTFAGGGYTGPGGKTDHTGHRVAGVVHQNEWVAPEWMNQHPQYGGVIAGLEGVRRRGYAEGGFTGLSVPGASLRAPINPGAFLLSGASGGSSADGAVAVLAGFIEQQGRDINGRIDRLQVVNDARATAVVAGKYAVANKIGVV